MILYVEYILSNGMVCKISYYHVYLTFIVKLLYIIRRNLKRFTVYLLI